MMDTTGEIEAVNDAGLAFSGYDRESLVGASVTRILAERTTAEEIAEAMVAVREWHGDVKVRTAEGRTVYGQGSVAPVPPADAEATGEESRTSAGLGSNVDGDDRLPDADGNQSTDADGDQSTDGDSDAAVASPCGYVAAFVDARQKRQYETAAEVLNRLLRHDLKNDLNVVYGHLQQARAQIDDPSARAALADARETLSQVIRKSDRARDLRSLLERAYGESTYPVRVDRVLTEAVATVQESLGTNFELGSLPPVRVVADDLLSVVFEGVLENAVEHNDGEPHVGVDVQTTDRTAVVRIADDGPGMPQDEDVVFGRSATDALTHGDGLSLFFADSVVATYEGQIWFEEWTESTPLLSTGENGTVFKIELLLAAATE